MRCKGNKKQKGKVLGKADVIARVSYLYPRPRIDEILLNFRAPDNRVNPNLRPRLLSIDGLMHRGMLPGRAAAGNLAPQYIGGGISRLDALRAEGRALGERGTAD